MNGLVALLLAAIAGLAVWKRKDVKSGAAKAKEATAGTVSTLKDKVSSGREKAGDDTADDAADDASDDTVDVTDSGETSEGAEATGEQPETAEA